MRSSVHNRYIYVVLPTIKERLIIDAEDFEKPIKDLTRDEEDRYKHFSLLDRETKGILKPSSRDDIRNDRDTLFFPLLGPFQDKIYLDGYKITYEGLLNQLSSHRQTFWEVSHFTIFPDVTSQKTQKMFNSLKTAKLLEDFLQIAVKDIASRGDAENIEEIKFSGKWDTGVIDTIKNFIAEYGPLLFCSEHKFCFMETSSFNNRCAWDFKEHIADYVNLSRLLYAIVLCNPRRFKGLQNEEQKTFYSQKYKDRLEEVINKFLLAKVLFEQLNKGNYARLDRWLLPDFVLIFLEHLLDIQKAIKEGQPKKGNDIEIDIALFQMFNGRMDHDLGVLMGSNPLTFSFHTGGGVIRDINDPPEVDIFYDLGIGVGRILLIQFYQALIGSGRLVACSKCFKPYVRKNNLATGRNYCPACDRKKRTNQG